MDRWGQKHNTTWLRFTQAHRALHIGVIVHAPSIPQSSNATLPNNGDSTTRKRPTAYKPTFATKCFHVSLRIRDSIRVLKRYTSLWTLAIGTTIFFGTYFLSAKWKYPGQPINLYEWNALKGEDRLPADLIKKAELLEAFIERRRNAGVD
uniref:Uncharacterized protein n=1 Tax=Trichuris muris TaxID=70415 RepID=A0A5S6QAQ4_TRIMR